MFILQSWTPCDTLQMYPITTCGNGHTQNFLKHALKFALYCLHFFSNQSGEHSTALNLLEKSMEIEQDELEARPERMVELYALACTIYDDVSFLVINLLPTV